jgi:hypothetical protein
MHSLIARRCEKINCIEGGRRNEKGKKEKKFASRRPSQERQIIAKAASRTSGIIIVFRLPARPYYGISVSASQQW